MPMSLKIGITERGDAGIDLSWKEKLNAVDGAILITKKITDEFAHALLQEHKKGTPIILHATCTGWGGSWLEPNVPTPEEQLTAAKNLLDNGFPIERLVLRIDPIIPTTEGLNRFKSVLKTAKDRGLPIETMRKRISVLDEYPHVKERLTAIGKEAFYGDYFYAAPWLMKNVAKTIDRIIEDWGNNAIPFESCAEPKLTEMTENINASGCVSTQDINILGIDTSDLPSSINGQRRHGCLCCTAKKELLTNKQRCPNGCLYCYWK